MINEPPLDSYPEILIDGCNFFPSIFNDLKQAKHSIYIENYLVEPGLLWNEFQALLLAIADNNVLVKGVFDGFGSWSVTGDIAALNLHKNIDLLIYNPVRFRFTAANLRRTHIKLFIIDGTVAYTGGAGITDAFFNPRTNQSLWSELMVRISDSSVKNVCQLYEWKYRKLKSKRRNIASSFSPYQYNLEGWLYAHRFSTHWSIRAVDLKLNAARQLIWINSAYFYPTKKIIKYLEAKANAGGDVRLLLPGLSDVLFMKYLARGRYKRLLQSGVCIHEIDDRFLHSKIIIIDDWATIGTFNLDILSIRFNQELNFSSSEPSFISELESFYLSKTRSSTLIDPANWTKRHILSKVLERLTYNVVQLFRRFFD